MKALIRFLIAVPVAALITILLFLFMVFLISDEFEADEDQPDVVVDIGAVTEDVEFERRRTKVAAAKQVNTPPPAPQIERQAASQPTEAIATIQGAIPKFEAPKLERKDFKITVSDRDAQPLVRIPGQMPPKAEKSGHCRMRFDVGTDGAPFNIDAYSCTDRVFERESVKATSKFKYRPKIVEGVAVNMTGVETKITYRLLDDRGRIIPE
ncbi:MAG: energy transducer TonB [Hellea sp.]|nr:energy transducer TonB [Hellea sp.]